MDRLLETLLRFQQMPRAGGAHFMRLAQRLPPDAWLDCDATQLLDHGWPEKWASVFHHDMTDVQRRVDLWLEASPQRAMLGLGRDGYPDELAQIASPPLLLFAEGEMAVLARPQLAVVGSRNASPAARHWLQTVIPDLCREGVVITSGLARGIDGTAHQAALDCGGQTIAVLGSGPDVIYPRAHQRLAAAIVEQGLILSEFLPGTPPCTEHFPRRNRIISGLSRGVLVVEAAERSGSLITARCAADQGRDLFAVPGSPGNPLARGCNQLIRDGAKLVETAADIVEEWRGFPSFTPIPASPKLGLPRSPMLDNVGDEPTPVDLIAARSGLPVATVLQELLELELSGAIAAVPGGYQRLRRADHV